MGLGSKKYLSVEIIHGVLIVFVHLNNIHNKHFRNLKIGKLLRLHGGRKEQGNSWLPTLGRMKARTQEMTRMVSVLNMAPRMVTR